MINERKEEHILAELFEENGVLRKFKKNEFIFREDEESQDVYFVRSGLVKISQSAQEGQNITLFCAIRVKFSVPPKC